MTAPPPSHRYLEHPGPLAIAHRGGTESAPENSLAAFGAAIEVGLRHLETDVHLTADGVLVAFHDERLDRVTDAEGAIAQLPFSEVAAARIAGTEPIPTLDELLETFPDARFNIDAKTDSAVVPLAAALRRHDALDRTCLGAFSDDRLARLRALLGGEVCTSAGPREVASLLTTTRVGRRTRRLPAYQCLQVPVRHSGVEIVTPELLATAHDRHCQVHVWTVDDADEMRRLLDLGVDGIFTDRPSVLRSVLVERGAWS